MGKCTLILETPAKTRDSLFSLNITNRLVDCLQSAFSLKIRLVLDLIQRDCIPRCYYIGIETRREKTGLLFFLLGLTPSFLAASDFAARVLRFCV